MDLRTECFRLVNQTVLLKNQKKLILLIIGAARQDNGCGIQLHFKLLFLGGQDSLKCYLHLPRHVKWLVFFWRENTLVGVGGVEAGEG